MATAFRCMAAIIAGMIVALVVVVAVELFSAAVHPVPPDFTGTMEEMCLHVERIPTWVLALVVPAWAGAAFAGTWIAGRIGNRTCAPCVGLLLRAAVVFNVSENWGRFRQALVCVGFAVKMHRLTPLNVSR
jgi:hypothetical protein